MKKTRAASSSPWEKETFRLSVAYTLPWGGGTPVLGRILALLVVFCVNLVTYFREKGKTAPYFQVFAYILRLALTLLVITSVVAALLAGINAITAPIIAASKEAKTQEAIEAVLPGGGKEIAFTDSTGLVTKVYASETGYAVQVAPSGFGGTITMMVGVNKDGAVLGIAVISHTETAGLGSIAGEKSSKGEAFRAQFEGLSGILAVTKDGGQIDAISSATITSRAVTQGVNAALECVAKMG